MIGGDNERLYAMEFKLQLKRFLPPVGLNPRTARSAGQSLTLLHSEQPKLYTVLAVLSAIWLTYRATRAPAAEQVLSFKSIQVSDNYNQEIFFS